MQNSTTSMPTVSLYRSLFRQLRRWVVPKTRRHLQSFAVIVAATLQAQSLCLRRWGPCLRQWDCQDHYAMECLSHFVRTEHSSAETFYAPCLKHFLQTSQGETLKLTLGNSMLWNMVCLMLREHSIALLQSILRHNLTMIGFELYGSVPEKVRKVLLFLLLPLHCDTTILASA